ncbi:hypothetical protein H4R18_004751 [Coemansia javaensis]|uniref:Uncharacterized protein n=1 Tax=Coemansia javaensis TaxID=2761396 RepID=A0A9W8H4S5_9FUNG|nr:hypothetical protein H4R18_004751 [Coemansia javaensis]
MQVLTQAHVTAAAGVGTEAERLAAEAAAAAGWRRIQWSRVRMMSQSPDVAPAPRSPQPAAAAATTTTTTMTTWAQVRRFAGEISEVFRLGAALAGGDDVGGGAGVLQRHPVAAVCAAWVALFAAGAARAQWLAQWLALALAAADVARWNARAGARVAAASVAYFAAADAVVWAALQTAGPAPAAAWAAAAAAHVFLAWRAAAALGRAAGYAWAALALWAAALAAYSHGAAGSGGVVVPWVSAAALLALRLAAFAAHTARAWHAAAIRDRRRGPAMVSAPAIAPGLITLEPIAPDGDSGDPASDGDFGDPASSGASGDSAPGGASGDPASDGASGASVALGRACAQARAPYAHRVCFLCLGGHCARCQLSALDPEPGPDGSDTEEPEPEEPGPVLPAWIASSAAHCPCRTVHGPGPSSFVRHAVAQAPAVSAPAPPISTPAPGGTLVALAQYAARLRALGLVRPPAPAAHGHTPAAAPFLGAAAARAPATPLSRAAGAATFRLCAEAVGAAVRVRAVVTPGLARVLLSHARTAASAAVCVPPAAGATDPVLDHVRVLVPRAAVVVRVDGRRWPHADVGAALGDAIAVRALPPGRTHCITLAVCGLRSEPLAVALPPRAEPPQCEPPGARDLADARARRARAQAALRRHRRDAPRRPLHCRAELEALRRAAARAAHADARAHARRAQLRAELDAALRKQRELGALQHHRQSQSQGEAGSPPSLDHNSDSASDAAAEPSRAELDRAELQARQTRAALDAAAQELAAERARWTARLSAASVTSAHPGAAARDLDAAAARLDAARAAAARLRRQLDDLAAEPDPADPDPALQHPHLIRRVAALRDAIRAQGQPQIQR